MKVGIENVQSFDEQSVMASLIGMVLILTFNDISREWNVD